MEIKMEKCSPVEMRKNLEIATMFKNAAIDFVAMPAKNQEHKNQLLEQLDKTLGEISLQAEIDDEGKANEPR